MVSEDVLYSGAEAILQLDAHLNENFPYVVREIIEIEGADKGAVVSTDLETLPPEEWAEIQKLEAEAKAEAEPEIEVQEVVYNPTRIYLQEIGRVHLLSTADEKVLSKKTASGLTAIPDNVTL